MSNLSSANKNIKKAQLCFGRFQLHPPVSLMQKVDLVYLKNRAYLLEQGQPIDYVYYLCSGKIGIYNISMDGATSRVVFISPGEFIGEMELLCQNTEIFFSARAYDECEIIRIPQAEFMHWLETDSTFLMHIATTLAKKLHDTAGAICQHVRNDAIGIVSLYIVESVNGQFSSHGKAIIKDTRTAIAENCRISERTANRSIKYLCDLGYISLSKGKISVTPDQFTKLSNLVQSTPRILSNI